MHRIKLIALAPIFFIVILCALPSWAANAIPAKEKIKKQKISLSEVEPELIYALRGYSKFYGDQNTVHGGLFERSYLLGALGVFRNKLVDHGIYLDANVTQFLAGNLSGGENTGKARYNGTSDYLLTLDTAKVGLWSGGLVMAHGESSW